MATIKNSNNQADLSIEMLGGFCIAVDGKRIIEQVKKSSKIWKLIQYLIVYRHKTVPQEELIEVFCSEENMTNPGNALRTMIYRARAALVESNLPFADEIILSISGGYRWNDAIRCNIDAEDFRALLEQANTTADQEERLGLILQAADIYKGGFLPTSAGDPWTIPLERWYRTAFVNSANEALIMLMESGRYDDAEELCTKVIASDPFNEEILEYYLRALLGQGKTQKALEEYRRLEAMFYDVLGVTFSGGIRLIYDQILPSESSEDMPLGDILDRWLSDADFPGAYYCDTSVFKSICQIEARSAARSGRTSYIIRLEFAQEEGVAEGNAIKQLGEAIPHNLRKGDLYTMSEPNQYMLMLNSLTYEDCRMLIAKILESLDDGAYAQSITTSIKPLRAIP